MKRFNKFLIAVLAVVFMLGLTGSTAVLAAGPLTVDLGTAAPFAILAGTPLISDAGGTSVITGNVGLYPATGASIGLLQSQVTGTIYSTDAGGPAGRVTDSALLLAAKNDLTAAYTDVANRTPVTIVPTELGGQTLTPGVYASDATDFQISAPNHLILDAQGDASAVFIFEVAKVNPGLTVGPGSEVELIGDASACNIFWRVNAAAIDTTAVFKGNILAYDSITVNDGANIEGRLLAQTGQVTLINDIIAVPTCVASDTVAAAVAVQPAVLATTRLPNTGVVPSHSSIPWSVAVLAGVFVFSTLFVVIRRKKRAI